MLFDSTEFLLAQIKNKLVEIQAKRGNLLHVEFEMAIHYLRKALGYFECQVYKEAHQCLREVLEKATHAFFHIQDDLQRIDCIKIMVFCDITIISYNEGSKLFIPYRLQDFPSRNCMPTIVRIEIELLLKELKSVQKVSNLQGMFQNGKRKEVHGILTELNPFLISGNACCIYVFLVKKFLPLTNDEN